MEAIFHVSNSYCDFNEYKFILEGTVVEGNITSGMKLLISINNSLDMIVEIGKVEDAYNDSDKTRILVECADYEEVEMLTVLNIANEYLRVIY